MEKINESLGTQLSKARKTRQNRGGKQPTIAVDDYKSKSNINLE